jgi:esterase/lipase
MKAQEYNLTGNEKFSVWFTTMMMMSNEQLDYDSKVRIVKMAKMVCAGDNTDIKKIENNDPEEMAKYQEKVKEFEVMKEAIRKEMDLIKQVLDACYGEAKVKEDCDHQIKKKHRWKN